MATSNTRIDWSQLFLRVAVASLGLTLIIGLGWCKEMGGRQRVIKAEWL